MDYELVILRWLVKNITWSLSDFFLSVFHTERVGDATIDLIDPVCSWTRRNECLGLFWLYAKSVAGIGVGQRCGVCIGRRRVAGLTQVDFGAEGIGRSMSEGTFFAFVGSWCWVSVGFRVIDFGSERIADALLEMDFFRFVGTRSWCVIGSSRIGSMTETVGWWVVEVDFFGFVGTGCFLKFVFIKIIIF